MSSGTRSGTAGAGGNDMPRKVTQPTQDELAATALALANQQEIFTTLLTWIVPALAVQCKVYPVVNYIQNMSISDEDNSGLVY